MYTYIHIYFKTQSFFSFKKHLVLFFNFEEKFNERRNILKNKLKRWWQFFLDLKASADLKERQCIYMEWNSIESIVTKLKEWK